jgi:uncharacterized protein
MTQALWPKASALRQLALGLLAGAVVGTLGGLIGLGGAEFRLPLLISLFGFAALTAIILNKSMSLVVVASALLFRTKSVPVDDLLTYSPIIVNLLAGSLLGAWFGAGWGTKMKSRTLYRVMAVLLALIAVVLLVGHGHSSHGPLLTGPAQMMTGVVLGFGIGVVASLMGVAGGELLIPTLILLFGIDVKIAGSVSLAVSLPTMIVGFFRYSRDGTFAALSQNKAFIFIMAGGSLIGTWIGAHLLGIVSNNFLLPLLAMILILSSIKIWRHK